MTDPLEQLEPVELRLGAPHPYWHNAKMHSDGLKILLNASGFHLMFVLDPLSTMEATAMQKEGYRFGLVKMTGGYCFIVDTPVACFDGTFAPMLNHPDARALPDAERLMVEPSLRLALSIAVMDGRGIIRALRFTTVSPQFSRRLALWHEQGLRDWQGPAAWDAEIARLQRRYARPQDALRDASVICKGGD